MCVYQPLQHTPLPCRRSSSTRPNFGVCTSSSLGSSATTLSHLFSFTSVNLHSLLIGPSRSYIDRCRFQDQLPQHSMRDFVKSKIANHQCQSERFRREYGRSVLLGLKPIVKYGNEEEVMRAEHDLGEIENGRRQEKGEIKEWWE